MQPVEPKKASGDAGAHEEGAPILLAAAQRMQEGDLIPVMRLPLLVARHGIDWFLGPTLTAILMGLLTFLPGGMRGLINLHPAQVVVFLVLVPASIWLTLFLGVEGCREDLAGQLDEDLPRRWLGRLRRAVRTGPLLAAQLAWLAPVLLGASSGGVPLLKPLAYPALFWAGFSSYFLLAEVRLGGASWRTAFLMGQLRAARALLLGPLDALAHLALVLGGRGRGLLRPSAAAVSLGALITSVGTLALALVALIVMRRPLQSWSMVSPGLSDALFLASGSLGFTLAAQIGASFTAYTSAGLYAAEQGLMPGGGLVGLCPPAGPPEALPETTDRE